MLDKLTVDVFAPCLQQSFQVYYTPTDFMEVQLIEARDITEYDYADEDEALPARRKPFSLIFRSADKTRYLPQHIYTIKHENLGALDIFLVPIGPDKKGMRYQAIFN